MVGRAKKDAYFVTFSGVEERKWRWSLRAPASRLFLLISEDGPFPCANFWMCNVEANELQPNSAPRVAIGMIRFGSFFGSFPPLFWFVIRRLYHCSGQPFPIFGAFVLHINFIIHLFLQLFCTGLSSKQRMDSDGLANNFYLRHDTNRK